MFRAKSRHDIPNTATGGDLPATNRPSRRTSWIALAVFIAIDGEARGQDTPVNLKIAFIGDQGLNANSVAVLQLIDNEGSDVVVHSGDFDYADNPQAWDNLITSVLGPCFPYFASVGNHDVPFPLSSVPRVTCRTRSAATGSATSSRPRWRWRIAPSQTSRY